MTKRLSIGEYLLEALRRRGVRHVFGVPGDYVLGFYGLMEKGPVRHVGATREDAAGLAADAYARVHGLGAACVTYCVGGLSMANAIAGAYAEKSPVVMISGAPGLKERVRDPLLHHRVRDFNTQRRIFEHLTVATAALEDPQTAYCEIDRVLHAVERYKRPGYIELPRDMVNVTGPHRACTPTLAEITDTAALAEAIKEATAMINAARKPVILAGVEVHRFGLQDALVELVERTRIPVAATILGKSVISEEHPLYLGVYEGAMGRAEVQKYVESSDCVIMLGCFMTDLNLGVYTADLDTGRAVYATSERLSVRRHFYHDVPFRSFFKALLGAKLRRRAKPSLPPCRMHAGRAPRANDRLTVRALFRVINDFIDKDMLVIADVGDALFGAIDLAVCRCTEFLSPAYYTSMGFAVPASIGAQLARPRLRPLVLVGDGAFHMTGFELATTARLGLNPIVVVLNNHGYGTERQICDGAFNDIPLWAFSKVPEVLGAGCGFTARTVGELQTALREARANAGSFSIIDADLDLHDTSPALLRLGERLGKQVKK